MKSLGIAGVTDAEIIEAVRSWETGLATYVARNILSRKHPGIEASAVLRRLKSLEKKGKVQRVPNAYAVMISWAVADKPAQRGR